MRQPDDPQARSALSYAATLAGAAFQLPKNAMVHACSFPLSARYHLSHGAACAFTLEEAVRLNVPAMGRRMMDFLRGIGLADAEELIALVRGLKRLGGLPCTLREAGIPPEDVPQLARESFHPLMRRTTLRTLTEDDLIAMYQRLV